MCTLIMFLCYGSSHQVPFRQMNIWYLVSLTPNQVTDLSFTVSGLL